MFVLYFVANLCLVAIFTFVNIKHAWYFLENLFYFIHNYKFNF